MKRTATYFIFFVLLSGITKGQTFVKSYGDSLYESAISIDHCIDHSLIISGIIAGTSSSNNNLLLKTDTNGNMIWQKTVFLADFIPSVKSTSDSGFIACGVKQSGQPLMYAALSKLDSACNMIWGNLYSSTLGQSHINVEETNDNGYILSGDMSQGPTLIKTDVNGNTQWMKYYDVGVQTNTYSAAIETFDGGFAIVSRGPTLIKTDSTGNVLWAKNFGLMDSLTSRIAVHPIVQTADSGFAILIIGNDTSHLGPVVWLFKTNKSGTPQWTKEYRGVGAEVGESVKQTSDGGFIISGIDGIPVSTSPSAFLIKTDLNGDTLWTKSYGDTLVNNHAFDVVQMDNGGYIFCGTSTAFDSSSMDIRLVRTDPNGSTSCFDYDRSFEVRSLVAMESNVSVTAIPATIAVTPFSGNTVAYGSEYVCNLSGIVPVADNIFSLYPNPSAGRIIINAVNTARSMVNLFDVTGKQIDYKIINAFPSEIQFNCSAGIYFLRIENEHSSSIVKVIFY